MVLSIWARKHGVSPEALAELRKALGQERGMDVSVDRKDTPEGAVQNRVRLEAAKKGVTLWRNNVGATPTESGGWLRYGLCNDTKQLNKKLKSSDLIGIRPILIGPEHMGQTLGQFVAREVKESNWAYRGTDKEKAQLKFLELVTALGGDASFANSEGTI